MLRGMLRIVLLGLIEKLLNRFTMFTEKRFVVYVLDDYALHLMP